MSRGIAVAAVVVLLVLPIAQVHAQSASSSTSNFDIGYSPGILFPASGGTPVFSSGDQVWARSGYNYIVKVDISPEQPNATAYQGVLPPGAPVRLLSINSSSPQGLWVMYVANSTGTYPPVLFLVSDSASTPAGLTLARDTLVGGSLAMNFTTSPSLALYSGQACVLGKSNTSGVVVPVPGQVGGGSLTLARAGETILLSGQGLGSVNFSLSLELYYSYSFLAPNSAGILLTRDVRVASAPGVLVSHAPGIIGQGGSRLPSLTLREDAPLKPGQYQLRVFFEGSFGILLSTADVLITGGGSWVWLGQCTNFPVYSNDFGLSVPVGGDPNTWPRTVWLTYNAYGQQGWAEVSLNVSLATVNFLAEPWGVKLSSYRIDLNEKSGITQAETFNGTAYVILGSTQGSFAYSAGLGTRVFFRGNAGPLLPFATVNVLLNVSKIVATYLAKGTPYQGARVTLSDVGGNITSGLTDARGAVTFYAPPGTYSLAGKGGNSSAHTAFTLPQGQSLEVVLGGPEGTSVDLGTTALIAAAAVGAVANLIVYVRRSDSKRANLRASS